MKRIQSMQNEKVKQWKKLLTRKGREKSGLFIVEGEHLVEEALKEKDVVTEMIISESSESSLIKAIDHIPIYIVSNEIAKALSETEHSQNIFAVCRPKKEVVQQFQKLLLIDGIQDPGNLGTIIRTADAIGLDAVIIGEGTVDLYNGKVLRAAQGSHFHLPIIKGKLEEWISKLSEQGIPTYGSALHDAIPLNEVKKTDSYALIVGNEGRGIRKELLSMTTANVYIPMYGRSESLNVAVASGILMYYFRGVL